MKHAGSEGGSLTAWVIAAAILLASLLLAAGIAAFFLGGSTSTTPLAAHGFLRVVGRAVHGVGHFEASGLIEAGLLVLLLAPFARLVAGAVQSARGGDWRFVAIGIAVAALLLTGILLGTR